MISQHKKTCLEIAFMLGFCPDSGAGQVCASDIAFGTIYDDRLEMHARASPSHERRFAAFVEFFFLAEPCGRRRGGMQASAFKRPMVRSKHESTARLLSSLNFLNSSSNASPKLESFEPRRLRIAACSSRETPSSSSVF